MSGPNVRLRRHRAAVAAACGIGLLACASGPASAAQAGGSKKPSLKEALKNLKVPPDWLGPVQVSWDTGKPWKQTRLEIRRLLGGDAAQVRQGIKLTYLYVLKKDIGNGHEYPLYLLLGGEYAWALQEYNRRLAPAPSGLTHDYLCLATCYKHFGEYAGALKVLNLALKKLPGPPWRIAREAEVNDHIGDVYAEMGDLARAKQHYRKAIQLYPTSTQPWGRHLLKKEAARVQAKLNVLAFESLKAGQLKDGTYTGSALGYKGDVRVTVTVAGGRIADVRVAHKEDIEQNATKIVPKQIVAAQSLRVDGVTGATRTTDAIVAGTYEALKQAGLR